MKYLDLATQWRPLLPRILEETEADMKIGRFVGGPRIQRLEEALSEFTMFSHCICTSTGTMALEAACTHLGLNLDATWGIPDLTFQATAFAALRGGLTVEALPATRIGDGCLQEPRYDKPTIPVDLYGTPVNWNAPTLYPLLIDGCQSLGARIEGNGGLNRYCVGETGVWAYAVSFYPGKNLGSMGEGGALLTHDPQLAEFARAYINQGQKTKGKHELIGTNGRMAALQAIPLYHGLKRLERWNYERQLVGQIYDGRIAEINKIHYTCGSLTIPKGRFPTRHVYPVFAPRLRKEICDALTQAGIPFGRHYPEQLSQSACFEKHKHFESCRTEHVFNEEISLPIHPFMTDEEIHEVCDVIQGVAEKHTKDPEYVAG